jgi:hypothetical protein
MAEVVERRKVIIEFENRIPNDLGSLEGRSTAPSKPVVDRDLVEAIRRELIRTGSRNPDIFGGRA